MGKKSSKKKSRNNRRNTFDEEMMFSETVTATEEAVEEEAIETVTAAEEETAEEAVGETPDEAVAEEAVETSKSVPNVNIMTELTELQEKVSNLESELSESKHTAKTYLSEIYALRAEKNSLKNGCEKLKEHADLLSAENLKLVEKLDALQDELKSYQSQQTLQSQQQSSHIRKRDLAAALLTQILSEFDN